MNVCHSLGMVFYNLVFPLKPFQTVLCLHTSPYPCHGMERRMGGKKGKDHRLWWEQFTGNNSEMRKWTVRAAILMAEGTRKGEWFTQRPPDSTQLLPPPHCADPEGSPFPVPWVGTEQPPGPGYAPSWPRQKLTLSWLEPGRLEWKSLSWQVQ